MNEQLSISDRPISTAAPRRGGLRLVARAREGADARYLLDCLTDAGVRCVLHIARDAARMAALEAFLRFFAPGVEVLRFPAWDCLPYDRVSPRREIMGERLATLRRLADQPPAKFILLTTANAIPQRTPPITAFRTAWLTLRPGQRLGRARLVRYLEENGYRRVGAVMEPGEYAVRGGLVDLYPAGFEQPVRVDFFGEVVETVRSFDPADQRSRERLEGLELGPASEVLLTPQTAARFEAGYLAHFGAVTDDPLFEAVRALRPHPGMEHWLPLFYARLETLFDHLPDGTVIGFDHHAREAVEARLATVGEHYAARREPDPGIRAFAAPTYRPLPPEALYLDEQALARILAGFPRFQLSPFAAPPELPAGFDALEELDVEAARDFAPERADREVNLFDAVAAHLRELLSAGKAPLVTAFGEGARDRLRQVLEDHGLEAAYDLDRFEARRPHGVGFAVLPLEHGFCDRDACFLSEQDILGERLTRPVRRRRRAEGFLTDVTALREGDLVVHVEHGIGRFRGLVTLEVGGAPHDFLELVYAGGDRLFVPVESLELLSRYGTAEGEVALDRLGGASWQQRKARIKKRIREIAGELIAVAARRALEKAPVLQLPYGLYEEFAARFPYDETEDQARAIEAVLEDLASGRPMDRLLCGDVGFGKTEVAIRAAYLAAMCSRQVAVLCPTTLLAHQHLRVFRERFRGLPVRIEELSRFVPPKRATEIKKGLADGTVDIVIGTHALLASDVRFRDLALVVIDEEQHFGVAHKEKLKKLRAQVHVLTMTATPIPRTLHMALGGLKQLSVIATPPVDRLAVRTFVMPADPVVIREAILREHYRGGQTFYVCPHVADVGRLAEDLRRLVPEVKIACAHGRMPARELEAVMQAFYEGRIDVLVSTNIIESGLDVPNANTLIVHRADRFGLAQLYQLRGRVGRAKVRAYAYFTHAPGKPLSAAAEKRLQALQALENLGAGFQLAAQDLDIRGAGNLLGEEQSGHIREVGFELYNRMLEEAVAEIRAEREGGGAPADRDWSPQIHIDVPALIPEEYIGDLDLRLQTYRRLAALETPEEVEAFAAELVDRFGPMPAETRQLFEIVAIKQLCRRANVAKIDAGPRGLVIAFHEDRFPAPEALVRHIGASRGRLRLRPDHRLLVLESASTPEARLALAKRTMAEFARLAGMAAA